MKMYKSLAESIAANRERQATKYRENRDYVDNRFRECVRRWEAEDLLQGYCITSPHFNGIDILRIQLQGEVR